jgi:hypothetical protein
MSLEPASTPVSDQIRPSAIERVLIPAILILGLIVTATWTIVLGYGVVELVEKTL